VTVEELGIQVDKMKVKAFDLMKNSEHVNPQHAGYETYADLCAATVKATQKVIIKLITDWERKNPMED